MPSHPTLCLTLPFLCTPSCYPCSFCCFPCDTLPYPTPPCHTLVMSLPPPPYATLSVPLPFRPVSFVQNATTGNLDQVISKLVHRVPTYPCPTLLYPALPYHALTLPPSLLLPLPPSRPPSLPPCVIFSDTICVFCSPPLTRRPGTREWYAMFEAPPPRGEARAAWYCSRQSER